MEDYLLNVSETAHRLKTNKNFVYKLIEKGFIKSLKLGSMKIRNSEINRFLVWAEGKDLSDLDNVKELRM